MGLTEIGKNPSMAARKHKNSKEREAHLSKLTALYCQGMTNQYDLADALNVTQQQISRDLKILEERWRQKTLDDLTIKKGQQLQEIELVKREAWAAWER